MKKIGLCMIVKDEAEIIVRCLNSIRPIVDYILICDTGSSDRTKENIVRWLEQTRIPGEVIDSPWVNFAHNRSLALSLLKDKGVVDYALMIDADEVLAFNSLHPVQIKKFKGNLTADLYNITTKLGNCLYTRPQLITTSKNFYYRGVVHEFLDCREPILSRENVTLFANHPIQDSNRNKSPEKYKKDAEVIDLALLTEEDPFLISRYHFYLAQSLRDSGNMARAIHNYDIRAKLGGWEEEVYISLLYSARMKTALKYPINESIQYFMDAAEVVKGRAEALYEVVKLCRQNNRFYQGYIVGSHAIKLAMPKEGLFLEKNVYEYALMDEASICAYYVGDYKLSKLLCQKLLSLPGGILPGTELSRVLDNLKHAEKKL